jgi:hypothetical protein
LELVRSSLIYCACTLRPKYKSCFHSPMARLPRSHHKPQISLFFLLFCSAILLVVLQVLMFPCNHCSGAQKFSASSRGGLRNHQNKCGGYLRYEADAAEHRKSAAALSKKKKTKLPDRKARIVCL